jgi:NDP-sugar pyrophosphorylase family protein
MDTKALILAAGLGTRLRPLTDRTPKCLIPIEGKPLLGYWLEALARAGVREALINTHHLHEQVEAYVAEVNADSTVQARTVYEPELLGSAGTVRANAGWIEGADTCLIIYADNLSSVDLGRFLEFHRSHDDPFTMLLFHSPNPKACGIAELDEGGRIVEFVEKPAEPKSDLANAGVYALTAEAYREIAAMEGFDLGFDVLPRFVGRMRGWSFDGYHLDIGNVEALEQARADAPGVFGGPRA